MIAYSWKNRKDDVEQQFFCLNIDKNLFLCLLKIQEHILVSHTFFIHKRERVIFVAVPKKKSSTKSCRNILKYEYLCLLAYCCFEHKLKHVKRTFYLLFFFINVFWGFAYFLFQSAKWGCEQKYIYFKKFCSYHELLRDFLVWTNI